MPSLSPSLSMSLFLSPPLPVSPAASCHATYATAIECSSALAGVVSATHRPHAAAPHSLLFFFHFYFSFFTPGARSQRGRESSALALFFPFAVSERAAICSVVSSHLHSFLFHEEPQLSFRAPCSENARSATPIFQYPPSARDFFTRAHPTRGFFSVLEYAEAKSLFAR